jgi:hypothetical protein
MDEFTTDVIAAATANLSQIGNKKRLKKKQKI